MKVPKETCHERQCMLSLQVKSQTTSQQDTDMIFFLKWLIYSRQVTHHSMLDFPICKMRIILPQALVLRIEDANTHGVRNHKPSIHSCPASYASPTPLRSHKTMNYEVSSDISCDTNRYNHSKREAWICKKPRSKENRITCKGNKLESSK